MEDFFVRCSLWVKSKITIKTQVWSVSFLRKTGPWSLHIGIWIMVLLCWSFVNNVHGCYHISLWLGPIAPPPHPRRIRWSCGCGICLSYGRSGLDSRPGLKQSDSFCSGPLLQMWLEEGCVGKSVFNLLKVRCLPWRQPHPASKNRPPSWVIFTWNRDIFSQAS